MAMSQLVYPKCRGGRVHKLGTVPTKSKRPRQRYRCRDCASTFYLEEEDAE